MVSLESLPDTQLPRVEHNTLDAEKVLRDLKRIDLLAYNILVERCFEGRTLQEIRSRYKIGWPVVRGKLKYAVDYVCGYEN